MAQTLSLTTDELNILIEHGLIIIDTIEVFKVKHIEGIIEYDEIDDNHYSEDLLIVSYGNKMYANILLASGTMKDDMSWDDDFIELKSHTKKQLKELEERFIIKQKRIR